MEIHTFDCIVIGAGAAGLLAAWEIAKEGRTVAVIEAKDRTGGRMFTISEDGYSVELGAEFVHGDLPLSKELLRQAGATLYPVSGSLWQNKDGQLQQQYDFVEDYIDLEQKCKRLTTDKSVADFLVQDLQGSAYDELRYSLKNYVEGYDAADLAKASAKAMCQDLSQEDEEQYRIEGGYRVLVNYLEQQGRSTGVHFFLSQPVLQLHWKKGETVVITENGSYKSATVLVTVSLGVLQQNAITFLPTLPAVHNAAKQLGFGQVVKLVLRFRKAFWKEKQVAGQNDLARMGFLFSQEEIPTWWTHFPQDEPVLTGWLGGPRAKSLQQLPKTALVEKALLSLGHIFRLTVEELQEQLVSAGYYNWSEDPQFFGAYSFTAVGADEAIAFLKSPVEDTIFFAGEGLHQGPEVGTVEAALVNGKEAAKRLLSTFSG